jgi:hypothetical protein
MQGVLPYNYQSFLFVDYGTKNIWVLNVMFYFSTYFLLDKSEECMIYVQSHFELHSYYSMALDYLR